MSAERMEETKVQVSELEKLMQSLKETLIELRGLVDELSNPVIPYQPPAKRATATIPPPSPASTVGGEALTGAEKRGEEAGRTSVEKKGEAERKPGLAPTPASGLPIQVQRMLQEKLVGEREKIDLERLAGLLRILYELQSKAPPEYLEGLVEVLYNTGLIDEVQKKTVTKLLELVQVGVSHGLGVQESIAILAALARELGLDVSEITAELVRAILGNAGAQRWESQQ